MTTTRKPGLLQFSHLLPFVALSCACNPARALITQPVFRDGAGSATIATQRAYDASTSNATDIQDASRRDAPIVSCALPDAPIYLSTFEDWETVEMPRLTSEAAQRLENAVARDLVREYRCTPYRLHPNATTLLVCSDALGTLIYAIPSGERVAHYTWTAQTFCQIERMRCPLGRSWLDIKHAHRMNEAPRSAPTERTDRDAVSARASGFDIPDAAYQFINAEGVHAGLNNNTANASGLVTSSTHYAILENGEVVACGARADLLSH